MGMKIKSLRWLALVAAHAAACQCIVLIAMSPHRQYGFAEATHLEQIFSIIEVVFAGAILLAIAGGQRRWGAVLCGVTAVWGLWCAFLLGMALTGIWL